MMRGRTITRDILEFQIFNVASMRAAGEWDDTLRAPKLKPTTDGKGTTARDDNTNIVEVRGQIHSGAELFRQIRTAAGDDAPGSIVVHLAKRDMERAGLLDQTTHAPRLRKNDRLMRVLDSRGRLRWEAPDQPGMFVEEVDDLVGAVDFLRVELSDRREAAA